MNSALKAAVFAAATTALIASACARAGSKPIAGGSYEASGVVHLAGHNGVLFVDDNDAANAYWLPLTAAGAQREPAVRVPLGVEIVDPEAMTTDGQYVYIVGSQSKPGSPPGVGLIRFAFDAVSRSVQEVEAISGLKQLIAASVPSLGAFNNATGDDNFNIEGLAWDGRGSRLLIGLRAPVIDGQALVVSARLRDNAAGFTAANLDLSEAARLPLNGAGIRSIEFDAARSRFLIVSGASPNEESMEFRIVEWDPAAAGAALPEVARFPADLKPEGLTRTSLSANRLFVVFDVGRYQLLD